MEEKSVDREDIRKHNRQLILNHLRVYGPMSRAALAKQLGLTRATVSTIVKELVEKEQLLDGAILPSTKGKGGKPAIEVHFNADAGCVIGIDLGRMHLRIYLADLSARIIDKYESRLGMQRAWREGLERIVCEVNRLLINNHKRWEAVRGIGFSVPGSADPVSGKLISPPLVRWADVDIPQFLRNAWKLPGNFPIYLDNDANFGALGENHYGAGQGIDNLLYLKVSTGIGVGFMLNGKLYRGSSGTAGEIGHVRVADDSPRPCPNCGKQGCLEALAGLEAIVTNARERSTSVRIHSQRGQDITPEHMKAVITGAQAGDAGCRDVLEEAGKLIGTVVGVLINVYNPSMILLDGGVIRPGQDNNVKINSPLIASLMRSAVEVSLPVAWNATQISLVELDDDAVGLGAVATVLDNDETLKMPRDGV
jgi:predicted NBD/HSP70 family sugar kinase